MSVRLTIGVAGALAICLILAGRWRQKYEAAHQPLQVIASELNLGQVWLQDPISRTLHIRNTTSDVVRIASFDASCACTSLEPRSMVLAAGESKPIEVVIDLARAIRDHPDKSQWSLGISVKAIATDSAYSSQWRLSGRLVSPLQSLPAASEPVVLLKTDEPQSRTVSLSLQPGIALSQVKSVTEGLTCTWQEPSPHRIDVSLLLDPAHLQAGSPFARCDLVLLNAAGQSLPPFPLALPLEIQPSVELEPSILLAGARPGPAIVELKSRCGRAFTVLKVGPSEGIAYTLLPGDKGATEQRLKVIPTLADDSMALIRLPIEVRSQGATFTEHLSLLVQRPTRIAFQQYPSSSAR